MSLHRDGEGKFFVKDKVANSTSYYEEWQRAFSAYYVEVLHSDRRLQAVQVPRNVADVYWSLKDLHRWWAKDSSSIKVHGVVQDCLRRLPK
eukprot:2619158-Lingulodinium_polyedra.AAC.1